MAHPPQKMAKGGKVKKFMSKAEMVKDLDKDKMKKGGAVKKPAKKAK